MRQGQQNRRGRGRGRKVQNPLSRNYESNGPDVKIRGNAAHIAEKYTALARDAQASGDTIMAENFLQHAEHYNRIIMAAQAQNVSQQPSEGANGAGHRDQDQNDEGGEGLSEDSGDVGSDSEMRAAEAPKPNGRSRRGSSKDKPAKQDGAKQDEAKQAEGQQGEDMAQESDNAAA